MEMKKSRSFKVTSLKVFFIYPQIPHVAPIRVLGQRYVHLYVKSSYESHKKNYCVISVI